jgi:hypothetical protein
MKKIFQYVSLSLAGVALIGIGLILDRVGGYGIRTDDVSSSVVLSVPQPVLPGVPFTVRWDGDIQHIGVTLRFVSEQESLLLGEASLVDQAMSIVLPCGLPPAPYRLELIDVTNRSILGVSSLEVLPAGPDCV